MVMWERRNQPNERRERNEEIYRLRQEEGLTMLQLARKFGLRESRIHSVLLNKEIEKKHKASATAWADLNARNDRIFELYKDGRSLASLAREFGLTYNHVWRIVRDKKWEEEEASYQY